MVLLVFGFGVRLGPSQFYRDFEGIYVPRDLHLFLRQRQVLIVPY